MNRRFLLGTAAAVAYCVSPLAVEAADLGAVTYYDPVEVAPVQTLMPWADFTGYVGYGTVDDQDDELDDTDSAYYGGNARFSMPLGNAFSAQLDIFGEANTVDKDDEGYIGYYGAGGHVNFRDPNRGLLGVFGGFGVVDPEDDDFDVWWAGVEAQAYLDMWTLYGQVGWAESDSDHDSLDWEDYFLRGVVRYYVNENFLVEAEASYTQAVIHSEDMDTFGWGAKTKFAVANLPGFLNIEYRGTHFDAGSEGSATEHVGLIGWTFSFGGSSGTLLEQDRYGATVDTPLLPLRAAAWTSPLD